jgi:hypothetical protein
LEALIAGNPALHPLSSAHSAREERALRTNRDTDDGKQESGQKSKQEATNHHRNGPG